MNAPRHLEHKPRRDELLTDVLIERIDEKGDGLAFVDVVVGPQHDDNIWWDGLGHDSRSDLYRVPITLRNR